MTTGAPQVDRFTSALSQRIGLLALRVSAAGLLFWWGLVKGLNTGTGQAVSNKFYGGVFSMDVLLIAFGWFQVVVAILIALGLFRAVTLPIQFVVNLFVALSVWRSLIDPFWLWMGGDKPDTVNALFYPSLIVAAACWILIAFRAEDRFALDNRRASGG